MIRQLVIDAARALDAGEIPFAVGGDIAVAYYGKPRMRPVIDVHCGVSAGDVTQIVSALQSVGIALDGRGMLGTIGAGLVEVDFIEVTVRFLCGATPFETAALHRARLVPFGGHSINLLSCGDLVVYKAMFNRLKDWADVEQVLHTQGAAFDVDYARGWLVAMVGEQDERVTRLDALLAEVAAAAAQDPSPGDPGPS